MYLVSHCHVKKIAVKFVILVRAFLVLAALDLLLFVTTPLAITLRFC